MTSGRLAVLIVSELIEKGHIPNHVMNAPCAVVRQVIEGRMRYGDVACHPDEHEIREVLHTEDSHGQGS